ncbi:MAG: hypothetical protein DCC71_15245 [Proteobacteria bacterium]|nr:MAG: hypothetical protein DCC71_15245 [Pseudomonadota bacterium]
MRRGSLPVKRRAALALAVLCLAPSARAGDGRIEINQTCAVQTGCGPGDAAGFPVSTQASQSYLLTSDLTLPSADSEGVRVAAGVTLDLGGFSIVGPTACTGSPAACTGTGNGDGILVLGGSVAIRNGRVAGAGRNGVYGSSFAGSLVEHVVAQSNGQHGFDLAGAGFQVLDCRAAGNGADGFFGAYQGSGANLYSGSLARGNGDDGFDVSNAVLLDVTAFDNGDYGLFTSYANDRSAWGRAFLRNNNGGNANPQAAGGTPLGTSVCGASACP